MCLATRLLARTRNAPSPPSQSHLGRERSQCRCSARGSRLALARHTGPAFHSSDRRTASAVRGHTVQHVPRRYVVRVRDRPARNERSTSGPLSHSLSDELCFCAAGVRGQGIRRLLFAAHSSKKDPPPLLVTSYGPGLQSFFTFAVQPGPRKQKKIRRVVGAILLHPSPNSTRGHQLASCLAPSPPLPIGKKNESLSLLPTTHLPPLRPCHR